MRSLLLKQIHFEIEARTNHRTHFRNLFCKFRFAIIRANLPEELMAIEASKFYRVFKLEDENVGGEHRAAVKFDEMCASQISNRLL
jgi:hypothetical protein